jgi:Mg/Co/Ni transporter MgtE
MTLATTMRIDKCPGALPRGILAGIAWGLTMGLALPLWSFLDCGVICLSDVAVTTGVSVAAGILAIGPLAAFHRAA